MGRTSQFPYWFHCSNSCSGFPDTCLMIPDARIKKQSIGSVSQVCRTITRSPLHTHHPHQSPHTHTHIRISPQTQGAHNHIWEAVMYHIMTHMSGLAAEKSRVALGVGKGFSEEVGAILPGKQEPGTCLLEEMGGKDFGITHNLLQHPSGPCSISIPK